MTARKSAEDRKVEIVEATLALAFEAGPDRVTTGMIAGRLGLTQPAIYKHFPRKQDIWHAVSDGLGARIAANIAEARARQMDPVARLRRLVLGHVQLVHCTPALPEIMVTRGDDHAVVRSGMQASMAAFFAAAVEMAREAQQCGEFRDDSPAEDIVTLVFGVIQSLILRLLVSHNPAVLLQDGERLLDLQLSAFSPQGATL